MNKSAINEKNNVMIHCAKYNKSRQRFVERTAKEYDISKSQVFYDGAQALQFIINNTGQCPDSDFYMKRR